MGNKIVEYFHVSFKLSWIIVSLHLPFSVYEPEQLHAVKNNQWGEIDVGEKLLLLYLQSTSKM